MSFIEPLLISSYYYVPLRWHMESCWSVHFFTRPTIDCIWIVSSSPSNSSYIHRRNLWLVTVLSSPFIFTFHDRLHLGCVTNIIMVNVIVITFFLFIAEIFAQSVYIYNILSKVYRGFIASQSEFLLSSCLLPQSTHCLIIKQSHTGCID